MKRSAFYLLVVVCFSLQLQGAPAPKPTKDDLAKAELKKLDGTWKVVYHQNDGVEATEQAMSAMAHLTFKNGEFSFAQGGSIGKISQIDPTASPKTIDYTMETTNENLKTQYGIYKFDGEIFIDCVALGGKDRPREFVSKMGSGFVLVKYKRVKD